jgi:REP element-mobilizing transposase RayT
VVYFVTLCVRDRKSVLAQPNIFGAVNQFCRDNSNWNTIAAVIMPDHLHALVSPKNKREEQITQFSAGLKRFVGREVAATWQWQHGVFDCLLRREESAESKWIYMRENPVRGGFVERWEDWPYFIGYTEPETNLPAA